jgi:hypothetical protein
MEQYTNPKEVQRLAYKYLGKDAVIRPSTRATKKYMVLSPDDKWIHFGQMGYEDFTLHRDPTRRARFKSRNRRWATADKWTPAFLSYYLLW